MLRRREVQKSMVSALGLKLWRESLIRPGLLFTFRPAVPALTVALGVTRPQYLHRFANPCMRAWGTTASVSERWLQRGERWLQRGFRALPVPSLALPPTRLQLPSFCSVPLYLCHPLSFCSGFCHFFCHHSDRKRVMIAGVISHIS